LREAFAILECFATIENHFSISHVAWRNISHIGAVQFTRRRVRGTTSPAPPFFCTNNTRTEIGDD
jgi:hypothetical protein